MLVEILCEEEGASTVGGATLVGTKLLMDACVVLGAVCVAEKSGLALVAGKNGLCVECTHAVDLEEMMQEADLLVEDLATGCTFMGTRGASS